VGAVLIVDDESAIRELLKRYLSGAGHDIRDAQDAETAIQEIARSAPDVVMCDVEMPGKGGLWLAGQIVQRFPTTAVVLATALDSVPPATSMQPGIVQYLVKPFKREHVVDAVARGIHWHDAAVARGPNPSEDVDKIAAWLDSIKE
jgi:DNA-binding NtrC family response regulator